MPAPADLDRLVARAQRGDALALDAVCARARPMLLRHARRLLGPSADVDDAVQDVLAIVCRRIGSYRWEGSFASWLYSTATRQILRTAGRSPGTAELALELAEQTLVLDHEPMTEGEWRLVEQELHLACTIGVLVGLSPEVRRLYLLGEVLAVPDRVGAAVAGLTPPAYRKRLERARRAVAAAARGAVGQTAADPRLRGGGRARRPGAPRRAPSRTRASGRTRGCGPSARASRSDAGGVRGAGAAPAIPRIHPCPTTTQW